MVRLQLLHSKVCLGNNSPCNMCNMFLPTTTRGYKFSCYWWLGWYNKPYFKLFVWYCCVRACMENEVHISRLKVAKKMKFAVFIFIIPIHLLCQIWANSPGVNFLRAMSNFRKKKITPSLVYLLIFIKPYTRHFHVMAMQWRHGNVQKKCDACAELLFLLMKTNCYFDVPVVFALVGS